MRARLEALAARLEAEAAARSNTADMQAVARAGVYSYCAAQIRALLAETSRVRMEPQPPKGFANPKRVIGTPCRFYWSNFGEDTVAYCAPSHAHRPVLVDGVWWWEVSNDPR